MKTHTLTEAQKDALEYLEDGYYLARRINGTRYDWFTSCGMLSHFFSPHANTIKALIDKGLAVGTEYKLLNLFVVRATSEK